MSKKLPRPHQIDAINAITQELETTNRTSLIMACGTGKTLIALWAAEKMQAHTILVLLPSLSLVKQTVQDWLHNNSFASFNYICVCSDDTVVEEDTIVFTKEELGFLVTTHSEDIQKFLTNSDQGCKVVFSTYQSCQVVAEGMPEGFVFDFGIFDEAHKTSGKRTTHFSYALWDEHVAIHKRLFMTATPRHYRTTLPAANEVSPSFSMDDTDVYGNVCYRLSFRDAVEQDLICDYKIIIATVTSDMITRDMLQKGEVFVDNDFVRSKYIAQLISLQDAVKNSGSRKIISFHSSVKSAKDFVSPVFNTWLPEFNALNVNGKMSAEERENIINLFRTDNATLISNARCLTEGIDIPAVDMIAFMDPKKSRIDIIQAIGRAMRKSPGKTCGYIFIPLFVEVYHDESLELALLETDYGMLFDIVQSIKEQDDLMAHVIAELRAHDNGTEYAIPRTLRDKIQFIGPKIHLDQISQFITTKIIERTYVTFEEYYEQLIAYKEEHGHCNVPERNFGLGAWVHARRHAYRVGKESSYRIKKMEEIGFLYVPFKDKWNHNIQMLIDYKNKHGHCDVPRSEPLLGGRVNDIRMRYKRNELSQERIDQLNAIGFTWDAKDAFANRKWEENFEKYVHFVKVHNRAPKNYVDASEEELALASWKRKQRNFYRQGTLSADRIEKLRTINFNFEGNRYV